MICATPCEEPRGGGSPCVSACFPAVEMTRNMLRNSANENIFVVPWTAKRPLCADADTDSHEYDITH